MLLTEPDPLLLGVTSKKFGQAAISHSENWTVTQEYFIVHLIIIILEIPFYFLSFYSLIRVVLHLCTLRWKLRIHQCLNLPVPFLSTSFVGVYVFHRRGDGSEGSRPLYIIQCSPHIISRVILVIFIFYGKTSKKRCGVIVI